MGKQYEHTERVRKEAEEFGLLDEKYQEGWRDGYAKAYREYGARHARSSYGYRDPEAEGMAEAAWDEEKWKQPWER